ncbi:amidase family protein [Secundilactobacillus muriivasis]
MVWLKGHRRQSLKLGLVIASVSLGLFGVASLTPSEAVVAATTTTTQQQATLTLSEYEHASALQLAQMVRSGKVTKQQLIQLAMTKIKQDNPQLNAVLTLREDKALSEADAMTDTGQPFYGVPILIKGLAQELLGEPATQGLPYSSDRVASYTKPFVKQLQSLGFVVIGQTNYPELGLLNVTTSKLYGTASNPWDTANNPGGSSGGAAASVADDMVPLATGNDAGGSIRIPASWSGTIGLKPTSGMIVGDSATSSMASFAETESMADTEALFDNMLSGKVTAEAAPSDLKGQTIAYSTKSPVGTPVSQDAVNAVNQTVAFLKRQGFNVKQVDSPVDGKALMMAYYKSATSSGYAANTFARSKFHRDLEADDGGIMTYALYEASKKLNPNTDGVAVKQTIATATQQMVDFHKQYPLYLTPTTATTAPSNSDPAFLPEYVAKLRNIGSLDSAAQMQLIYDAWLHGLSKSPFTQLANLTGEPAISLPTYVSADKLPLGVQFQAAKGQDRLLLAMGKLFEDQGQLKMRDTQNQTDTSDNGAANTDATTSTTPTQTPDMTPQKPTQKPVTTPTKPATKAGYPKAVYAKTGINVYKDVELTHRVKHFTKQARTKAVTFNVLGVAYSKGGALRYRVKGGYITANKQVTAALYYQTNPKRVRVVAAHGIYEYQKFQFKASQRTTHLKKGAIVTVKLIKQQGKLVRLQLTNGQWVTGNKTCLIQTK